VSVIVIDASGDDPSRTSVSSRAPQPAILVAQFLGEIGGKRYATEVPHPRDTHLRRGGARARAIGVEIA